MPVILVESFRQYIGVRRPRQLHGIVLRKAHRNSIPGDFDLGVHLLSAAGAKPDVLRLLLTPASLIAEDNIQTERLPSVGTAKSRTEAIGTFAHYDTSSLGRVVFLEAFALSCNTLA